LDAASCSRKGLEIIEQEELLRVRGPGLEFLQVEKEFNLTENICQNHNRDGCFYERGLG